MKPKLLQWTHFLWLSYLFSWMMSVNIAPSRLLVKDLGKEGWCLLCHVLTPRIRMPERAARKRRKKWIPENKPLLDDCQA
jgi:hypothetical protein